MACFPFDCEADARAGAPRMLALIFGALFRLEDDGEAAALNGVLNLYKRDFDPIKTARTAEDVIASRGGAGGGLFGAIAERLSSAGRKAASALGRKRDAPASGDGAARGSSSAPRLVIDIGGESEAARYEIDEFPCVIGRADDADVVVSDPGVSRRHAVLSESGGAFAVSDNNSANGVSVNDKRLKAGERRRLKDGDVIAMANTTILVEIA
jgi:hypothetical protein